MSESVAPPFASLRGVQRALRSALPDAELSGSESTLETWGMSDEPPRLASCELVEDAALLPHVVTPPYEAVISAFLDGTQRSQPVCFIGGVPVVFGRVASVVRQRVERRMVTWRSPLAECGLFADTGRLPGAIVEAIVAAGLALHDTRPPNVADEGAPHPNTLLQQAVRKVQERRERLEHELALQWCAADHRILLIDGGLPPVKGVGTSASCVGVVKSHHTLYAPDGAADAVYALDEGERTSVFRIARAWGPSVHSWYLRLRRERGRDPFWGLVRVEVAIAGDAVGVGRRADEVSAWILGERTPLALPDGRWDRMMYGIRDCEEYLRARG